MLIDKGLQRPVECLCHFFFLFLFVRLLRYNLRNGDIVEYLAGVFKSRGLLRQRINIDHYGCTIASSHQRQALLYGVRRPARLCLRGKLKKLRVSLFPGSKNQGVSISDVRVEKDEIARIGDRIAGLDMMDEAASLEGNLLRISRSTTTR